MTVEFPGRDPAEQTADIAIAEKGGILNAKRWAVDHGLLDVVDVLDRRLREMPKGPEPVFVL